MKVRRGRHRNSRNRHLLWTYSGGKYAVIHRGIEHTLSPKLVKRISRLQDYCIDSAGNTLKVIQAGRVLLRMLIL